MYLEGLIALFAVVLKLSLVSSSGYTKVRMVLVSCGDGCATNTSRQPSGKEEIETCGVLVFL